MIVIADDITGAAEIAGIAFEAGQQVRLRCGSPVGCDEVATQGTTVIATDTRSMTEEEAIAETRRIILPLHLEGAEGRLLFKKTDSALRGHVVTELLALMQATGYQRAVFMPANPSKGRIIRTGTYYINGVPLHKTDFSFDPEFPARSASIKERFPEAEEKGIVMPDATNEADILRIVSEYDDGHTLFAGAADLFKAILEVRGERLEVRNSTLNSQLSTLNSQFSTLNSTLILCGSTQSKALDLGISIAPMPREIYDGGNDLSLWDTSAYDRQHNIILTIPYTHRTGKEVAVHLRSVMAQTARRLVSQHCPDHLIIEGGATAWATLQALGWTDFDIVHQYAPGVVQMKSVTTGTMVTLKPGSYPWGSLF